MFLEERQIDLNHEFAGRDLDYKITLKNVVNDSEKSKALFDKYFSLCLKTKKVQVKDKILELIFLRNA